MASKKAKPLLPYCTALSDGKEKRFLQLGNTLLLSSAVKGEFEDGGTKRKGSGLSSGAFHLYLCFIMEAGGSWEVEFPRRCAKKYGFPEATFDRHVKELCEKQFLTRVYTRDRDKWAPARYRFNLEWKPK